MSPRRRLSILTVFCRADRWQAALQARSMRMFCEPDEIADVLFIYNEHDEQLSDLERSRIADEAPDLPIRFAHCLDFGNFSSNYCPVGWSSQQVLKILGAGRVASDRCMILDAKNLLVSPLRCADLVAPDGRLCAEVGAVTRIKPQFQEVWRNCLGYFGLDPQGFADQAIRPVTPFLVHTPQMRDLVTFVERREGMSFCDFWITANQKPLRPRINEFMLLQAFAIFCDGGIHSAYFHAPSRSVTLWETIAENPEKSAQLMRVARSENTLFFALHRDAKAIMTDALWDDVVRFWQKIGLVASRSEADALCGW